MTVTDEQLEALADDLVIASVQRHDPIVVTNPPEDLHVMLEYDAYHHSVDDDGARRFFVKRRDRYGNTRCGVIMLHTRSKT